jgi:hypothetical protein
MSPASLRTLWPCPRGGRGILPPPLPWRRTDRRGLWQASGLSPNPDRTEPENFLEASGEKRPSALAAAKPRYPNEVRIYVIVSVVVSAIAQALACHLLHHLLGCCHGFCRCFCHHFSLLPPAFGSIPIFWRSPHQLWGDASHRRPPRSRRAAHEARHPSRRHQTPDKYEAIALHLVAAVQPSRNSDPSAGDMRRPAPWRGRRCAYDISLDRRRTKESPSATAPLRYEFVFL